MSNSDTDVAFVLIQGPDKILQEPDSDMLHAFVAHMYQHSYLTFKI